MRRTAGFIFSFLGGTFCFGGGASGMGVVHKEATRPNILFILVDDMGWSDPGFLGGDIETPHLDRLAREGTLYPWFFNHAKCEPSRASLLTGVHFQRQTHDHVVRRFSGVTTLAAELREAGYFTACSGKWHLPNQPTDWGFDRFFGLVQGAANHFDPDGTLDLDPRCYLHKGMYALNGNPFTPDGRSFYSTDDYTDYALAFLRERKEGQPFFLYLSYTAPHWPLQAPEDVIEKYSSRYREGWDQLRAERSENLRKAGVFPDGWTLPPSDPEVLAWDDWPQQGDAARCMAVHAAMIDRMDQQIGRVLAYLEETGEIDRTLICFTSDNGVAAEMRFDFTPERPAGGPDSFRVLPLGFANAANTPFVKYKTYNSNGGICAPLIVRWPGRVPAGAVDHQPVNILDFMPTFLDVAGRAYPEGLRPMDGQSLFDPTPRPMYFHLRFGQVDQKAVIDWPWKAWCDAGDWRLFNLAKDPAEANDLAPYAPDQLKELILKHERFKRVAQSDPWELKP